MRRLRLDVRTDVLPLVPLVQDGIAPAASNLNAWSPPATVGLGGAPCSSPASASLLVSRAARPEGLHHKRRDEEDDAPHVLKGADVVEEGKGQEESEEKRSR